MSCQPGGEAGCDVALLPGFFSSKSLGRAGESERKGGWDEEGGGVKDTEERTLG